MRFIAGLLAGAILGAGGLWMEWAKPQVQSAQEEAAKATDHATSLQTLLTSATEENARKDRLIRELKEQNGTPVATPPIQVQAPEPTAKPLPDEFAAARQAAVGEKVDALDCKGTHYEGLAIKEVNPAGIYFSSDSGGAFLKFEDLPSPWQERFGYDHQQAADFLAQQEADRQAAIQKDAAAAAPAAHGSSSSASSISPARGAAPDYTAAIRANIASLTRQLEDTQRKHDIWVDHSQHDWSEGQTYHSKIRGNIPDDISMAAIERLRKEIAAQQLILEQAH